MRESSILEITRETGSRNDGTSSDGTSCLSLVRVGRNVRSTYSRARARARLYPHGMYIISVVRPNTRGDAAEGGSIAGKRNIRREKAATPRRNNRRGVSLPTVTRYAPHFVNFRIRCIVRNGIPWHHVAPPRPLNYLRKSRHESAIDYFASWALVVSCPADIGRNILDRRNCLW